jgi:hypothetical protein
MKPKVILPYYGEFGYELMYHVYQANGATDNVIMCHAEHKDSLYPNASGRIVIEDYPMVKLSKDAIHKKEMDILLFLKNNFLGNLDGYDIFNAGRVRTLHGKPFIPIAQTDYDFETDVVIFPRKKPHQGWKNWELWDKFVDAIKAEGLRVFACGHPDHSFHLGCPSSWDYDNHNDATIWAITHSKVRIGVITALHLLSLMCGKDVWVITNKLHFKEEYLKRMDHMKVGKRRYRTMAMGTNTKWHIVVATSESHLPGFRALYNTFRKLYSFDEITMHLLHYDLKDNILDSLDDRVVKIKIGDTIKGKDKIWQCKIERFNYASNLDGVVMLLDADMWFCGDMRPYMYLAERGYIVGGTNGSFFRFHQGWREKYKIPEIPDMFDSKTITSVPTILHTKIHGEVWADLYKHKTTIGIGADFDLTNVFMAVHNKFEHIVVLPSQQVTGIHHFMLKPDTGVRKIDEKLVTMDGLEVLMVHGKWWSPGWYDNLMKPMEKYCRGVEKYAKMALESRKVLKEEFDKYSNQPLN